MIVFKPFEDKKFKNIVFDLGNVLINVNLSLTYKKFVELGLNNIERQAFYNKFVENGLLFNFEKGLFRRPQFYDKVRFALEHNFTDEEIYKAWNELLLEIPQNRIDLLYQLKSDYKLYLLSNTNEIHLDIILHRLVNKYKRDIFSEIFTHEYYSHHLHMRKPDVNIFHYIIKHAGFNPSETLFIDDAPDNIQAANSLGIIGYLIDRETDVTSLFTSHANRPHS